MSCGGKILILQEFILGIQCHKFHFGPVSEDSINFGNGFHTCLGRFLAQQVLKLVFVNLQNYEFKWQDEDGKRPPTFPNEFALTPNPTVPILIRARKH
ncbi:Cytochrome P450 [Penicillium fimorum]|uniref:Cytochrome P450 n=1 Tax=Penicillium fimorum TaxID=1882269 RepID=A0A9X0C280_9EURO|nr:Cytochrome P450 [Penicillium fimorum]